MQKETFQDFFEEIDQQNAVFERIQDEAEDFMKLVAQNELSYRQTAEFGLQ
jgi:hypothetical protein